MIVYWLDNYTNALLFYTTDATCFEQEPTDEGITHTKKTIVSKNRSRGSVKVRQNRKTAPGSRWNFE
jgi:hypothetical protein